MVIAAALVLAGLTSPQAPTTRLEFWQRLQLLQEDDKPEKVEHLLGKPDDVLEESDLEHIDADLVWSYGTEGHRTFATLGSIHFRRGRVYRIVGDRGKPPHPKIIDDQTLRRVLATMGEVYDPDLWRNEDPLRIIRTANSLIPLGKEAALAAILEFSRLESFPKQRWIFWLIRAVFERMDGQPLRMPLLGLVSPDFEKLFDQSPLLPLAIRGGVPYVAQMGILLRGASEPIEHYLKSFDGVLKVRPDLLRPDDNPFSAAKGLPVANAMENYGHLGFDLDHQLAMLVRTVVPIEESDSDRNQALAELELAFKRTDAYWSVTRQMYVRADGMHFPLRGEESD